MIAKPIKEHTTDEICELIFHTDWRMIRNSFQNIGVYRNLIHTMQSDCAVELEGKYYIISSSGFRFAIESEPFEKMYRVV